MTVIASLRCPACPVELIVEDLNVVAAYADVLPEREGDLSGCGGDDRAVRG